MEKKCTIFINKKKYILNGTILRIGIIKLTYLVHILICDLMCMYMKKMQVAKMVIE